MLCEIPHDSLSRPQATATESRVAGLCQLRPSPRFESNLRDAQLVRSERKGMTLIGPSESNIMILGAQLQLVLSEAAISAADTDRAR